MDVSLIDVLFCTVADHFKTNKAITEQKRKTIDLKEKSSASLTVELGDVCLQNMIYTAFTEPIPSLQISGIRDIL